jgi:hypothetical protein
MVAEQMRCSVVFPLRRGMKSQHPVTFRQPGPNSFAEKEQDIFRTTTVNRI